MNTQLAIMQQLGVHAAGKLAEFKRAVEGIRAVAQKNEHALLVDRINEELYAREHIEELEAGLEVVNLEIQKMIDEQ